MNKKQLKEADARINRVYLDNCKGVQVSVMDIGKIFTVGRGSIEAGDDDSVLAKKIVDFVNTIRKN